MPWRKVAIFNVVGFLDFYARFIADEFQKLGTACELHGITFPALERLRKNPTEMRSVNIARIFDRQENVDELVRVLREKGGDCEAVVMPAIAGLARTDVLEYLERQLGKRVALLPTLPPSVPGIRAQLQLRRTFEQAGGVYMLGDTVLRADEECARITRLYSLNHGDIPFEVRNVVLATGSYFSQGLVALPGKVCEPVLGLDVEFVADRKEWYDMNVFAAQRYEAFGVDKLGDEETVAAVTPRGLWERYQDLLSTARVEVYYCGSADPDRVEAALRAALADLPVNGDRADPDCEVRLTAGPEPRLVEESMDVTQGKLALGFRTGGQTCWEPDYPAFTVMNAIFGGTTLSKLFLNVREKLSLCYYASSAMEKMKGLILVSSGIEFDKFQTARDEILAQLEAIRRGEIEDWELEGARHTLMGGHLATLDDQGRQEEFWLGQAAAGLDSTIPQLAAQFEAVTREQVAAAARKLELDTIYFLKGKGA